MMPLQCCENLKPYGTTEIRGNEEGVQIGRSVGECCPSSITMYMLGSLAKVHLHRVHGAISKSQSHKTYNRKISQNLDGAKSVFRVFESPWNMADVSAALLSWGILNLEATWTFQHSILRFKILWDLRTRYPYRILKEFSAIFIFVLIVSYRTAMSFKQREVLIQMYCKHKGIGIQKYTHFKIVKWKCDSKRKTNKRN